MQKNKKKLLNSVLRKYTFKFLPFDPMLIFETSKNPIYSDWITLHLLIVHEVHPKEYIC